MDVIQFILYLAVSVVALAEMILLNVPNLEGSQPLFWFLILFSAALLQSRSPLLCWRTVAVLSSITIVLQLLYCFGSIRFCDLGKYAVPTMDITTKKATPSPRSGDAMRVAPLGAWLFIGADAIALGADPSASSSSPRVAVLPIAQRRCTLITLAMAVITFFITASLPSGTATVTSAPLPFGLGYSLFSSLTVPQSAWLSVPASFASIFGFLLAYSRLIAALAASCLVPQWLASRLRHQVRHNRSVVAHTAISSAVVPCFLLCLLLHHGDKSHARIAPLVCVGLAFISYANQTICYLMLRSASATGNNRKHPLLRSKFRSPFGYLGAIIALVIWGLALLSVLFLQMNGYRELIVIVAIWLALSMYYFIYARYHQVLSIDERAVAQAAMAASSSSITQSSSIPSSSAAVSPRQPSSAMVSPHGSVAHSLTTAAVLSAPLAAKSSARGLVRADSAPSVPTHLGGLMEELGDDTAEPYAPDWITPSRPPPTMLGSTRRAGSDSVLSSSTSTTSGADLFGNRGTSSDSSGGLGGGSLISLPWGRSFLRRPSQFEKIREETERDLRSALSGIWSERSVRWSRGRGGI